MKLQSTHNSSKLIPSNPFCKIPFKLPISLIGIGKNVCTFEFMVSPDQVHLLSVVFQTGEFYILGDHCEFLQPLFVGKLNISNLPLNLDQSEFKMSIYHLCCSVTVPIIILNKMYQD